MIRRTLQKRIAVLLLPALIPISLLHARVPAHPGAAKTSYDYADKTGSAEGEDVLRRINDADTTPFRSVSSVSLEKIYDATKAPMESRDSEPKKTAGSYAKRALVGFSQTIMLWGPYDELPAGRHLVVYRFKILEPLNGAKTPFVDVAHGAVTYSGSRPEEGKLPAGWNEIAIAVDAPRAMPFEFRFWPNGHHVAIDRIYVYRLRSAARGNKLVSVMGAVNKPGLYRIPADGVTAEGLIEIAGGRIPLAHPETIGLWRARKFGHHQRTAVADPTDETALRPADLLWVPERQAVGQLED